MAVDHESIGILREMNIGKYLQKRSILLEL
jgi:hypothetical protein